MICLIEHKGLAAGTRELQGNTNVPSAQEQGKSRVRALYPVPSPDSSPQLLFREEGRGKMRKMT